jgi:hypothetical protein
LGAKEDIVMATAISRTSFFIFIILDIVWPGKASGLFYFLKDKYLSALNGLSFNRVAIRKSFLHIAPGKLYLVKLAV